MNEKTNEIPRSFKFTIRFVGDKWTCFADAGGASYAGSNWQAAGTHGQGDTPSDALDKATRALLVFFKQGDGNADKEAQPTTTG